MGTPDGFFAGGLTLKLACISIVQIPGDMQSKPSTGLKTQSRQERYHKTG
jgi:hypothetical protein